MASKNKPLLIYWLNNPVNQLCFIKSNVLLPIIILFLFCSFQTNGQEKHYPEANFWVFSDPHFFSPSLWTEGSAIDEYLENDRKLLKEGPYILKEAFELISDKEADFLLIPGDLTKDGTLVSHRAFANFLTAIEKTGKQVYVVPGNHDINNPQSFAYADSQKVLIPTVNPAEFCNIYAEFGFNQAIAKDINSLSYIVEPIDGLWLFALDACCYRENAQGQHPVTGGKFSSETLIWIENELDKAAENGKSVVGFMHHGILEHYKKQSKFFEDYVIEDFKPVSKMFAEKGMNLVFTGHYHAQDIVKKEFPGKKVLYDIETGSLVTYPCPVREIKLSENRMEISSHYIKSIETMTEDFEKYSRDYVWSGIDGIARKALISYKLNEEEAAMLSGQVADAFIAHYAGDEPEKDKAFDLKGVSLKGRFLISFKKKLVHNLWNDPDPKDNELIIEF
jgi:3',5'-cyclic AMP phosphodiesterase CpdA